MAASNERPLDGKVAVVTGASRRIGRATALGLAEDGAAVVVTAQSARGEIEAVAEEIRKAGGKALALMMELTDERSVNAAVAEAERQYGRIDILVNNAAIRMQSPFLDISLADWRRVMSVNLDGPFLVTRAVLPVMLKGGGGTIVMTSGSTAHTGTRNRAHVAASKAALVGLTKALAVEFADRNITVNCVAPGKIGGERSATSGKSPIRDDAVLLGRDGEIEEAAFVVRMLCQPQARFMTGQTVHVSGGLYLP
jgi:3-oxoacyl-[acyl-carrier protein] reductase